MGYFINPKRKKVRGLIPKIVFYLKQPILNFGSYLGFLHIDYSYVNGYKDRIKIGEGCFIASGVTILAPVKIGDHVIIGAGSIVMKDIPSGCFVAGVPAKIISHHAEE